MRKLHLIIEAATAIMLCVIGVAAYANDTVAGAIFICTGVWLAFKDERE